MMSLYEGRWLGSESWHLIFIKRLEHFCIKFKYIKKNGIFIPNFTQPSTALLLCVPLVFSIFYPVKHFFIQFQTITHYAFLHLYNKKYFGAQNKPLAFIARSPCMIRSLDSLSNRNNKTFYCKNEMSFSVLMPAVFLILYNAHAF